MNAWLQTKPREVAVALAARAALRVLPVMETAKPDDYLRGLALRVFRAAAFSWGATRHPAHAMEFVLGAAGAAAFAAARTTRVTAAANDAVNAATRAASTAAAATNYAVYTTAVETVATAARALPTSTFTDGVSIFTTVSDEEAFWSAVSFDASSVEEGATASDIAGSPLWPRSPSRLPYGVPEWLWSLWQDMKAVLHAADEDWQVWTTWYEDRLEGRVRSEERELAYVRIENGLWHEGPAVVNAEIRRRIEEAEPVQNVMPPSASTIFHTSSPNSSPSSPIVFTSSDIVSASTSIADSELPPIEAIPEQAPVATTFRTNSEGLIDVVPDPPALETIADPLQRELYEETRTKAQDLLQLGHNQLGELSNPAERFREALKERIEDLSIASAWSRGNTLRSRLRAHDVAIEKGEPDPARLPPLVAETLRDLVQTWNVFIIGDPKGRELDEVRLGPAELDTARRQIAAAGPIVEAVKRSENVATSQAIEVIVEQNSAAVNAPVGIDGDQAIDLSRKTTGNFVIQLLRGELRFAWRELRAGVYRAPGTTAVTLAITHPSEIASFIAQNAEALKRFAEMAWHNPAIAQIIDVLARAFH